MIHRIRFAILKKRIKNNPHIGKEDSDGTYVYKKGGYSIRYRVINLPQAQIGVEWVSRKRRYSAYEEKIRRIKKGFFDFWNYQRWFLFFRPPIVFILIAVILIFYFKVMQTQEINAKPLKWIVASVMGISPDEIQYIGDGWLEISGQRRRKVERINEPPKYEYEPIKYTFNPLRWLFFSEGGFIKSWRSEAGGYATHPVVYNDKGDVWLRKQDTWVHGRISGKAIQWDTPQVTGLSLKKTPGHEVSIEDKKIRIIDK